MTNFETKVKGFVEMQDLLSKEEAIQLGRKDPNVYPFFFSLFDNVCFNFGIYKSV